LEVRGALLDTHVLLWLVLDDPRLSPGTRKRIQEAERIAYSMASLWEIAVKLSGRGFEFELPLTWEQELVRELRAMRALRVTIEPEHCRRLQDLPWHHKDPFDRMLIAQADVEDLAIITADRRFSAYDVKVLW
jgi:PIN domain nuclease of toxin-antitoxin system